jgi:hypothetical protein
MTRKQYRTAQGKIVDLGAIQLQNEHVRAVGNMNVNARGDTIDSKGNSIDSRNKQLSRQYNRQIQSPVTDQSLPSNRRAARQQAQADVIEPVQPQLAESSPVEEPEVISTAPEAVPADTSGGLAAAIAKARAIKQEPLKSSRQQAQETPGVRKI